MEATFNKFLSSAVALFCVAPTEVHSHMVSECGIRNTISTNLGTYAPDVIPPGTLQFEPSKKHRLQNDGRWNGTTSSLHHTVRYSKNWPVAAFFVQGGDNLFRPVRNHIFHCASQNFVFAWDMHRTATDIELNDFISGHRYSAGDATVATLENITAYIITRIWWQKNRSLNMSPANVSHKKLIFTSKHIQYICRICKRSNQ